MEKIQFPRISQSVRFRDTTIQIQTVVLNGILCLRFQDVKARFPSASVLCIDNEQLVFLCDKNGNDLEPLRIEARPDKVIEAIESIGQSNDAFHDRLDRIAADMQDVKKSNQLILANTQETLLRLKHIMTQMYELHEFTTPRYFFLLPAKHYDWGPANAVTNFFLFHYKLYFLCECSDDADKLHVAPHEGYSIKKPKEFIVKYAPYLKTTLTVARALLTIGSFVIPQLGHASAVVANKMVPHVQKIDNMKLGEKLIVMGRVLDNVDTKVIPVDSSESAMKDSSRVPLQGAQLRELESYLGGIDNSNSLGNLYRTTTDDGHVRWVCLAHYSAIGYNRKMSDYIRQFEAFGGKFNEETNGGEVTGVQLTTKNIDFLCDALKKGFNMLSLTFEQCSLNETDLGKLFEVVINLSSVHRLVMSHVTVRVGYWIGTSEYVCGCMSIQINNKSLNIRFFERSKEGDIKLLILLWSQNKICRTLDLSGGDFSEHGIGLRKCLQERTESEILFMKYLNNIDILCDILGYKSSLTHLKLSFWSSPPDILSRFCEVLGRNSTLTELSIMDHQCANDGDFINQLLVILRGHKSIKRLTLYVYNIKPNNRKEACLVNALFEDAFIVRLHISESIISNQLAEALVHASQKTSALKHLELYDCRINDEHMSSLLQLQTIESLTHLTISKEQYWFVAMREMRRQLQEETGSYHNNELEKIIQKEQNQLDIYLFGQELTDRDMETVIREAIDNKQCIGLYLGSNQITSIGVSILADALNNNNQQLRRLWLDDNHVCDDGVYSLAKVLSVNNKTLKELDLRITKITDEGVKHLAQMLKNNQTLTHLYLNHNNITDRGARILASTIQNHNTTIEVLHLSGNKFLTDACVDSFLEMIKTNQSLKTLRVDDCSLSKSGTNKLKSFQPSRNNFQVLV